MSPRQGKKSSGLGTVIFTVLALLLTFLTAWLLSLMLAGTEYTKEPVRPVVVAADALEPFQALTKEHLKVVKLPESAIPEGSFSKVEDLVRNPPYKALVALHPGEILFEDRLADPEAGEGLATLIPPGMRAMVVKVDLTTAWARLFYPGALVDVLATMRLERLGISMSRVILQGVKVLAVGRTVDAARFTKAEGAESPDKQEETKAVVTLLVDPRQAEQLTLAVREGKVDLMLRSPKDQAQPETGGARPEDLFPELANVQDMDDYSDKAKRAAVRRILSRPRFKKQQQAAPVIQVQ